MVIHGLPQHVVAVVTLLLFTCPLLFAKNQSVANDREQTLQTQDSYHDKLPPLKNRQSSIAQNKNLVTPVRSAPQNKADYIKKDSDLRTAKRNLAFETSSDPSKSRNRRWVSNPSFWNRHNLNSKEKIYGDPSGDKLPHFHNSHDSYWSSNQKFWGKKDGYKNDYGQTNAFLFDDWINRLRKDDSLKTNLPYHINSLYWKSRGRKDYGLGNVLTESLDTNYWKSRGRKDGLESFADGDPAATSYWKSRGRKNQMNNILSGNPDSEVYWRSRGRKTDSLENLLDGNTEDNSYWKSRGRKEDPLANILDESTDPSYWRSRGRKEDPLTNILVDSNDPSYWKSRGRKEDPLGNILDESTDPSYWKSRGRKEDPLSNILDESTDPSYWKSRGRKEDPLANILEESSDPSYWKARGRKEDPLANILDEGSDPSYWKSRGRKEDPLANILDEGSDPSYWKSRGRKEDPLTKILLENGMDDSYWKSRGRKIDPFSNALGKDRLDHFYWKARGRKDYQEDKKKEDSNLMSFKNANRGLSNYLNTVVSELSKSPELGQPEDSPQYFLYWNPASEKQGPSLLTLNRNLPQSKANRSHRVDSHEHKEPSQNLLKNSLGELSLSKRKKNMRDILNPFAKLRVYHTGQMLTEGTPHWMDRIRKSNDLATVETDDNSACVFNCDSTDKKEHSTGVTEKDNSSSNKVARDDKTFLSPYFALRG